MMIVTLSMVVFTAVVISVFITGWREMFSSESWEEWTSG